MTSSRTAGSSSDLRGGGACGEPLLHPGQDRGRAFADERPRLRGDEVTEKQDEIHRCGTTAEIAEGGQTPQRVRAEEVALMTADLVAHEQSAQRGRSGDREQGETSRLQDPLGSHRNDRSRTRGVPATALSGRGRSEEHTSELQSRENLVCRLL